MVNCLVVDDDKIACEAAATALHYIGIFPQKALNGVEALEVCGRQMPQLIILDIMMPEMDGLCFIKELHKLSGGRKVYVIACTARNDEETVMSMRLAGVNDYIVKPFAPDVLTSKVKAAGLF